MSTTASSSSDNSRSSCSESDKRLSSASSDSNWSMHTVSSFIDDEIEHVDPFMLNLSPRTTTTPSPTSPLSRSSRPIIHIRTRSWGGDCSQMASPAPQTPLPPIPTLRESDERVPYINMLATPLEESCQSPATFLAARSHSSGRLVTLDEIAEEDVVSSMSRSTRNSIADGHMDSFLNFDRSSNESNGSDMGDERSISDKSTENATAGRNSVSNRLVHIRSMSALALNRMPPFKRGTSVSSCSSNEDIATPKDALPSASPGEKGHKRGSSWTRFREKIKGKLLE